jgi:formylglycine-generating enzyme required for sulfatase activity
MGSNPSYFKGENRPVEQVGWNDVQRFLEKLNARNDGYKYRLPTEAEWEFAARAGAVMTPPLEDVAWYDLNAGKETHPVGQKQPNAWGLHDMLGNVSEWVQDWFALDYFSTGPAADPPGPETGVNRVLRGGSWSVTSQQTRLSYRVQAQPTGGNATIGFRCVRTPVS